MKENEFDIHVRNVLLNGAETVSPKVWEGIAAGLDRKRRIVPMRVWGILAGAAAAAAVVAGILFLPQPSQPADHSNPIISIAEAEVPVTVKEVLPVTESAPRTLEPQIKARPSRMAQAVPVSRNETVTEEVTATVLPEPEVLPETPSSAREEVQPAPTARTQDDQALLNRLAYEEAGHQSPGGGLSVSAFGNLQDNRRGAANAAVSRPIAAPELIRGEHVDEGTEERFGLPFSAGIGIRYSVSPRWAVGTGVRYTNLSRSFVGNYYGVGFNVPNTNISNVQHWLGVPLHLYLSFVNTSRWQVHAFAGGSVEFLLDNDFLVHHSPKDIHYHPKSTQPQFSADLGLGVEFRLTPSLGLYLDPGFRYFFAADKQPRSVRTIQPLRFDVEAGVRFTFGQK